MAGLFSAINSATAGLRAIQADLRLVSDNIARAEDPTRTRQNVARETGPDGQVRGIVYQRRSDIFLAAEVNLAVAREGGADARNEYMTRIGEVLGTSTGKPPLATAMTEFTTAWRNLQATPENDTAKYQVIQLGERVATELRRAAEGVDQIERDVRADIAETVEEVNRLLDDINQINREFAATNPEGSLANDMLDRRDAALRELNRLIGVRSVERPDGQVTVFTASGLSLIDADRVQLRYDGERTLGLEPTSTPNVNAYFREGKLGALLGFVADGSTVPNQRLPSPDPYQETIRKLRGQLDGLSDALTAPSKPGEPVSFASAYDNARPLVEGELDKGFFVGKGRFGLQVNPALLDGTASLKASAVDGAADAISASGRSFTATGITVSPVDYAGMVSAVLGSWSNTANAAERDFKQAGEFKALIEVRYHSKVGVNLDEEIAALQELQTSYAAVARVMQVANSMFDALESILS